MFHSNRIYRDLNRLNCTIFKRTKNSATKKVVNAKLHRPIADEAVQGLKYFFANPKKAHIISDDMKAIAQSDLANTSKDEAISLWYQELRQKNMLMTMQIESFRQRTALWSDYQKKIDLVDESLRAISGYLKFQSDSNQQKENKTIN
ncbi:hypothetical protein MXB_2696 [Myxobolus squamalis]|nr:hypothetical protein MXB_2696 [Myxobolus squamalis]